MHQKFRYKELPGVVPQKQPLVQHQIYTWMLLIGLDYLEGINLPRGYAIYSMHYIYTAEGHRITFLTPHQKKKGIDIFHLSTFCQKTFLACKC